jgi:hypothetical protein
LHESVGKLGGGREAVNRPIADELEWPTTMAWVGCLHGERKGRSRRRHGLLIAAEWVGGARGGPGAHGDWTAAAHQWCAAESAGLTVDRRFETKFEFQMDSN